MIVLKKQQNIVLAQKPGDKRWKPGDREITIETGNLSAKPGELTGMVISFPTPSKVNVIDGVLFVISTISRL